MEEIYIGGPHSDRCAGCNASGVSLLACDDIDGKGLGPSSPSQRLRSVVLSCDRSFEKLSSQVAKSVSSPDRMSQQVPLETRRCYWYYSLDSCVLLWFG